jgi:S-adenosylmethionine:tRNA ribosyltransferase-isomerase
MPKPSSIKIEEYDYQLPPDRIAKFPLPERDKSKLLFLKGKEISEEKFCDLPEFLPENCLLLFNETKVIRARLQFRKITGALIEIFCLEPVSPSNDFQVAFSEKSPVVWKCLVGNAKRWKSGELEMKLKNEGTTVFLKAKMVEKLTDSGLIQFSWEPEALNFSEIIQQVGLVPLPPYLNRDAEELDKARYQTIYAHHDGSVAAPTAGLHFTEKTFRELKLNNIGTAWITLHVGAGTFKPVISNSINEHEMHVEKVAVSLETLKEIFSKLDGNIIPVGTTSMRTLESLFWMALKLKNGDSSLKVEQWDPYELAIPIDFSPGKAIQILIEFIEKNKLNELRGETKLMIAPGYDFKFAKGLLTNFHQPKSTLLLLVSALIGEDWRKAYNFALKNDFRFLSYGDICLFMPDKN